MNTMRTSIWRTCGVALLVGAGALLGYACGDDEARPSTPVIPTPEGGLGGSNATGGNTGAPDAASGVGGNVGAGGDPSADASDTDVSVGAEAGVGGSSIDTDGATGADGGVTDSSVLVEAGLVCDPYSGSYDNAPILQYLPGGVLPPMP